MCSEKWRQSKTAIASSQNIDNMNVYSWIAYNFIENVSFLRNEGRVGSEMEITIICS